MGRRAILKSIGHHLVRITFLRFFYALVPLFQANTTLAIDLSQDWTNSTVNLINTPRPVRSLALDRQVLWWNKNRNIIYCFGGEIGDTYSPNISIPLESIWAFIPDDQGSSRWNEAVGPTVDIPFPASIVRPATGASAFTTAYYLGGYTSGWSSLNSQLPPAAIENSPGLLKFDFASLVLTNSSDVANPQVHDYWARPPCLVDVSAFSTPGFSVAIGGGGPIDYDNLEAGGRFDNITIYDKQGQKWYPQIATGEIPEPRTFFCAVGVWDDINELFEM